MEIVDINLNSKPLSSSYEWDDDLQFIKTRDNCEEGFVFFRENYLKGVIDNKINNYSSITLTKKQKNSDIFEFKKLNVYDDLYIFNTSLIDNNEGLYLTLFDTVSSSSPYFFTKKDEKFVDFSERIFEIYLLNDTEAKILHRSKEAKYYYLEYDGIFKFNINDNLSNNIFYYILDKKNNRISFLKKYSDILYSVKVQNGLLVLDNDVNSFKDNYFNINYYIQTIEPRFNTTWVSYDHTHKNAYQIDKNKSRSDMGNNLLISNQYTYISGDDIKCNFINLKNQHSHKNYSYRSDYMEKGEYIPLTDMRNYVGLFTGNEQEKGDYSITLGYEFYNTDYKFSSDKYTAFKSPENLYPYKQININDLEWNNRGSIAGETPYTSDKIFYKTNKKQTKSTEYLCSWLFKQKNGKTVWLDRYFNPEKTTFANALLMDSAYVYEDDISELLNKKISGNETYDIPFRYNSLNEEFQNTPQTIKDVVYGNLYFDKVSDLVILPDEEYIYFRVGNNYVKTILDTLSSFLIENGLNLKNSNNSSILIEGDIDSREYLFDGNTYSEISSYSELNKSHQFTLSFWMQSDDWSKKFGYEILGNLSDRGFGIFSDQKITPIITVQGQQNVYIFNTNFELLETASLVGDSRINQNTIIKDIYRTDHLDSFYTLTIE